MININKKISMKGGEFKNMVKKYVSLLVAVMLFIMPVMPAMANDTPDPYEAAITKFKSMTSGIRPLLPELVNIMKAIDEENTVLNAVYEIKESNPDFYARLERVGLTRDNLAIAIGIFKTKDISCKDGYDRLYDYVCSLNSDNQNEKDDAEAKFISWLKELAPKIVKNEDAPLKALDNFVTTKFTSSTHSAWYNVMNFVYDNQSAFKDNVQFTYSKINNTITIDGDAQAIADDLKTNLEAYNISPLTESDVDSLLTAQNTILAAIPADKLQTVADALKGLGYRVDIKTEEGGGTGGTSGGGGGGAAPEKPAVEVPSSPTAPVKVSIPADAAKITEQDGKSVVTFDEDAINDILKLLDEAVSKADGRPTAVFIDLTGSDKIKDNISLVLPKEIVEKAFAKGASIAVNTSAAAVEIPASAFKAEGKPVTFDISIKSPAEVVKGFTLIQGISTVGKAIDFSLKVQDAPAKLDKAVTLRFKLKGIAANIDKLGIYYADTTQKKLEFVGGKVDRQAGEIIATLPHLSAYVLAEYNKTFADITGHWAKNYIESMTAKHVIDGRSQTMFAPNDSITRAEFAKIVVNTLGLTLKDYTGAFEDVKPDAWYADYVQTAFEAGLIQGKVEGKTFDPNGKITRQEMMTIIGRAIAKDVKDTSALAAYKDGAKVADYAKAYVSYLISERIIAGYPDMTIKPDASTTRAEAVKIIYGIYNR